MFHRIEINFAYTGWVSKRAVLTKKNVYLEKIKMIVGALIHGNLATFNSEFSMQREDGTQEEIFEAWEEGSEVAQATEAAEPEPNEYYIISQGPFSSALEAAAPQQEQDGEAPELSYPVDVFNTL